jgi:calcium-dependent protein kinase
MGEKERKMVENEINNIKELDHPNILKLYEFFEDEKRIYLVTDLCGGGELYQEISSKGKLTEAESQ